MKAARKATATKRQATPAHVTPRPTDPTSPTDREVRYSYSFASHYPKLHVVKFVYYAIATYKEVTGKKPRDKYVRDFHDEWGVFERYGNEWTLTGRNDTANVIDLTSGMAEDGKPSRFRFSTYADALRGLRAWLSEVVTAKQNELARAERDLAKARAMPDEEITKP